MEAVGLQSKPQRCHMVDFDQVPHFWATDRKIFIYIREWGHPNANIHTQLLEKDCFIRLQDCVIYFLLIFLSLGLSMIVYDYKFTLWTSRVFSKLLEGPCE